MRSPLWYYAAACVILWHSVCTDLCLSLSIISSTTPLTTPLPPTSSSVGETESACCIQRERHTDEPTGACRESYSTESDAAETGPLQELTNPDPCPICMADYVPNDLVVITACGHKAHKHCLLEWMNTKPTCPLCRVPVIENAAWDFERGSYRERPNRLFRLCDGVIDAVKHDRESWILAVRAVVIPLFVFLVALSMIKEATQFGEFVATINDKTEGSW